jgi:hypothetical protein
MCWGPVSAEYSVGRVECRPATPASRHRRVTEVFDQRGVEYARKGFGTWSYQPRESPERIPTPSRAKYRPSGGRGLPGRFYTAVVEKGMRAVPQPGSEPPEDEYRGNRRAMTGLQRQARFSVIPETVPSGSHHKVLMVPYGDMKA